MLLRVATWPMSFILQAKGLKRAYFWTEFCFDTVSFGLLWFCLRVWGLTGAGMATFGSFLFYWIVIYFLVRRATGFSWSKANVPSRACIRADGRGRLFSTLPVAARSGGNCRGADYFRGGLS